MIDRPPERVQPRESWRDVRERRRVRLGSDEEHLDRLLADRELNTRLALAGYEGPEWGQFCDVLARYGVGVITGWGVTGKIFRECAAAGASLGDPDLLGQLSHDDAEELAVETVAHAIVAFRDKVLIGNKWDPDKGATLKTFFVGQCKFQFPNVYRNWQRERDRQRRAVKKMRRATTTWSHTDDAPNSLAAAEYLDRLDEFSNLGTRDLDLVKQIAYLKLADYSNDAIAEMTGASLSAVKTILHNLRKRTRDIA